MNRVIANTVTWVLIGPLSIPAMPQNAAKKPAFSPSRALLTQGKHWIGTWATAPQPSMPGSLQTFRNQSLRLIVNTSAGVAVGADVGVSVGFAVLVNIGVGV